MSGPYRCQLTLRVRGEDLDPEEVSEWLGLDAHSSTRQGDPLHLDEGDAHRANGGDTQMRLSLVRTLGTWQHFLPAQCAGWTFEEQLEAWLELLEPREGGLELVRERGWRCVLAATVHTATFASLGVAAETVGRLGALGMELDISVLVEEDG